MSASARVCGKTWVTDPIGCVRRRPQSMTSRAASVAAPLSETCWPSTARIASSWASTWPGTRRPGTAADHRPDQIVGAERVEHRDRVGVEVEQGARALDGGGEVA